MKKMKEVKDNFSVPSDGYKNSDQSTPKELNEEILQHVFEF
jgi:hypothetical protein